MGQAHLAFSGALGERTASGPSVTLVANTCTELTVSGTKPSATEVYAGMEPDFSKATKGTIIYWDNMDLISWLRGLGL